jgi:CBS domain-containing protein
MANQNHMPKTMEPSIDVKDFQTFWFSELLKRRISAGKINNKLGKLTDLVFRLNEPYPEAVGIYLAHGWGKSTEFIPWDRVVKIESDAVFVKPPEDANAYPPFVDQPGWLLVNQHLMGRTILDMDGRRIEVVNDVHLLMSRGRMLIVHVDISFNGFLRQWGLRGVRWIKDQLISWRYVQPLSLEDAVATDTVSLSVTRKEIKDLPSEDLADALEMLSGKEQEAFFSALDTEKAAETLTQVEPRVQRQLIADLRRERARNILLELSIPQLADLFSVLPHHDMVEMMELLPPEQTDRIKTIISEREATARTLMSTDYLTFPKTAAVGEVLRAIRTSQREQGSISYIYVVKEEDQILEGVVDVRELLLTPDDRRLGEIMASPVVSAEEDDKREDLAELFAKYHYRMIPVVDIQDHIVGVIQHKDIMQGPVARAKT